MTTHRLREVKKEFTKNTLPTYLVITYISTNGTNIFKLTEVLVSKFSNNKIAI